MQQGPGRTAMTAPSDPRSDRLISATLTFLRRTLKVSGAMFYWIDPTLETSNDAIIDMPGDLVDRYRAEMRLFDPLLVSRLVKSGTKVGLLDREASHIAPEDFARYRAFLASYDVVDNIDLLFFADGVAYAGVSLARRSGEPPLPEDAETLEAIRDYLEFTLQTHARLRAMRLKDRLAGEAGLTKREIDVVELICAGASNQDIAELLGLRLQTVKSYVREIFQKMGCDSRVALVARVTRLQVP